MTVFQIGMLMLLPLPTRGRSIPQHFNPAAEWFFLQAIGTPHQCRADFVPALQCPASPLEHSPFDDNEFLGKRSTCPWVMCRDSNSHRQPRDIYYAKCLCTGCKGQSGEYSCQPIYTVVTVSRVTSRGIHDDDILRVPLGCTCAKNRQRILDWLIGEPFSVYSIKCLQQNLDRILVLKLVLPFTCESLFYTNKSHL